MRKETERTTKKEVDRRFVMILMPKLHVLKIYKLLE